ncbi:MAG: calcium/sodium antiporter [Pseudomonadota bacterium]
MEHLLEQLFVSLSLPILFLIIAVLIVTLGKGADILVDEAVSLSVRWGVPKILIGATIVSLGTTLPEVSVSVLAAINGSPGLALGNAVGSIICDTGLILGIAAIIAPLPMNARIVNRQGWVQLGSGVLLIVSCLSGKLPQFMGFVFLGLLVVYIWASLYWVKKEGQNDSTFDTVLKVDQANSGFILLKLILGIILVIASSKVLIPAVQEVALRLYVPESIIAATLVAFGTSLPELVTAIMSARKGHGDLAVGNIVGADILNVLFVSGAAAAVTPKGLNVDPNFFYFLFPAMLLILVVFRIGIFISKDTLKRSFGLLLLGIYIMLTILSYVYKT